MAFDAYQRSLVRALRANALLLPFARAFAALPAYASSLLSCDIVALTGARVDSMPSNRQANIFVNTLALRGYGPELCRDLCNMLHEGQHSSSSLPFSPANCMLLSKEQLVEEYGRPLGETLAETLSSPDMQPVLHAMLFGDPQQLLVVQRQTEEVVLNASYYEPANKDGPPDSLAWEVRSRKVLPAQDARYTFAQVTEGCVLETLSVVNVFPEVSYDEPHHQEVES